MSSAIAITYPAHQPVGEPYNWYLHTGKALGGAWWGIYPPVEQPKEVQHVFWPQLVDNSQQLIELGYLRSENERLRQRVKELEERLGEKE